MADNQKTAPPYFGFYPRDFMDGVLAMPADLRGCYISLLCFQWTAKSVPGDHVAQLRNIMGVASNGAAKKAWATLQSKFQRQADGRWVNARLEKERVKVDAFFDAQRAKAAKGGRPKKTGDDNPGKKPGQNPGVTPRQTPGRSQPDPDPDPDQVRTKEYGADKAGAPRAPVENRINPTAWTIGLAICHRVIEDFPTQSDNWSHELKARMSNQGIDPGDQGPHGDKRVFWSRVLDACIAQRRFRKGDGGLREWRWRHDARQDRKARKAS